MAIALAHPVSRKSSFLWGRRNRRRGQTLTEYVLLIAYISIFTLQAMDSMSFTTKKEYVITNCSLIVGQMQNRSKVAQLAAVIEYLTAQSTWGNADPAQVAKAQAQILATMIDVIYGS